MRAGARGPPGGPPAAAGEARARAGEDGRVLGVASGYDLLAVDATPGRLDAPLDPGDLFPPVNLCAPGARTPAPVVAPALRGPASRHIVSGSPAGRQAERRRLHPQVRGAVRRQQAPHVVQLWRAAARAG